MKLSKTKTTLCILLLFFANQFTAFGQIWEVQIGEDSISESASDMLLNANKELLILSNVSLQAGSLNSIQLNLLDTNGVQLWESHLEESSLLYGNRVFENFDQNGYYIQGFLGSNKLCLIHVDSVGKQKWIKTYDQYKHPFGIATFPMNDRTMYIVGLNRAGSDWPIFILKIDEQGNVLSDTEFFPPPSFTPYTYLLTKDLDLVISGSEERRLKLIKANLSGNIIWEQEYGTVDDNNDNFTPFDILEASNGDLVVTGKFYYNFILPYNVEEKNAFLLVADKDGNKKNLNRFVLDYFDYTAGSSITENHNNQYIITGNYYDMNLDYQIILIEADQQGNFVCYGKFAKTDSFGAKTLQLNETSYLSLGNQRSSTIPNVDDIFLQLTDSICQEEIVVSNQAEIKDIDSIHIFPNPVRTTLNLVNKSNAPLTITISSINGKVMKNHIELPHQNHSIDVSSLINGVYIIKAASAGEVIYSNKFIKF